VSERTVRLLGLAASIAYGSLVVWLYVHQPQTMAEVTGGLAASVGAYRIDVVAFEDGLRHFRADRFVEARRSFERADPAGRDPRTQFYIAYSYYRQGWGRLYHDDELYAKGLEALRRATAAAPNGRVVVDDPALDMHTGDELQAELEAGMRRDASDLNPLKIFRGRR
jgi:tetratricopeptide (TPR) repeat protein